jgi:hypothetical protein
MAAMMFSTLCVAAISDDAKLRYLPFGFYPTIEKQTRVESRPVESLPREVEALTKELGNTVKTIASHRNTTCFDNPCLFQAFPLIYERINSGFFGGARVKLTDVSRQRPYLYSLEGLLVRSDTQQWSVFLGADFPQIELVPFEPRLKVNFNYSRTTETKYFGSGSSFLAKVDPLDDNYRYALSELGYQSSLIVPITKFGEQKFGIFGNFSSIKNRPQPFADQAQSPLYNDQPTGIEGGYSTRVGAGVIIDSRDQEVLSRSGSALC